VERHLQTVRMDFGNIEDFRQCIRGAELEVVQLKPGRFTGSMVYSNVGGVVVSAGHFKSDVRSRGRFSDKHITLGTIIGDGARVSQWNLDALAGDIFFMPAGAEQEGRAAGSQSYATVSLSVDSLDKLNPLLGALTDSARHLEHPRRHRASPLVRAVIAERVKRLVSHIQEADPWISGRPLAMLQDTILLPFLIGMIDSDDPSSRRIAQPGASLVRKVEDWIEEQPVQSVIDICHGLGVSLRTLQRAFHGTLGIGPSRYLAVRRLARARSALLAADPDETSVTAIVIDCGFWELGRFAGYYRHMFGESPSETLRRGKGRSR
jgi:AraC-like DNA-binding protein